MSEESKRIEQMLIELKDTSELMVDLAYSSLLCQSKDIADRVIEMEEAVDKLHTEFELTVLESDEKKPSKEKLALIRLGLAAETIADAAAMVADIVRKGVKPHPIFKMVLDESEETVLSTTVAGNSVLIGKSLGELGLEDDIGMKIIAVFRDGRWAYNPSDSFELNAEDTIIVRGYSEGKEKLLSLTNPEER